jgi:hypothetical protein
MIDWIKMMRKFTSHMGKLFLVAYLFLLFGCVTTSTLSQSTAKDTCTLEGWEYCLPECGRYFASAYSEFAIVRLDDTLLHTTTINMTPGRHWVEAKYSWGFGIMVGIGNYRNYGYEFDFLAGHLYRIREVPSGCIVPWKESSVHPISLKIEDYFQDNKPIIHEIAAMEYCYPPAAMDHTNSGTCRTDSECKNGVCTLYSGAKGYGLCGKP